MSDANKALIQQYIEAFNSGDLDAAGALVSHDFRYHGPGQEIEGREGLKELQGMYKSAFSDATITIQEQIAEGDRVVSRCTASGTNDGALGDFPPSGKSVSMALHTIHRIEGGKIAEEWELFEELQMLQQMGAIPQ